MAEVQVTAVEKGFGSTARRDAWWVEIIPVIVLLGGFGVYATLRAFEGKFYEWGPYLSPFYSPLIDPNQVNVCLLTLYTFSCHSLRHLAGGKLDCFSCATFGTPRYKAWRGITALNERHMLVAWSSLISVGLADLYVRLVASGAIRDVRLF